MKTNRFLIAGLALVALAGSVCAQTATAPASPTPAPTDVSSRKAQLRQRMQQKFDTNGDGKLDADERAALKQAHAAHIKLFDTNGDGKIDANEKAAMRASRKTARSGGAAGAGQPAPQATPAK